MTIGLVLCRSCDGFTPLLRLQPVISLPRLAIASSGLSLGHPFRQHWRLPTCSSLRWSCLPLSKVLDIRQACTSQCELLLRDYKNAVGEEQKEEGFVGKASFWGEKLRLGLEMARWG